MADLFYVEFSWVQCLAFSSIIAATDPVAVLAIFKEVRADQTLYVLIFGESILTDAVSVILYKYTQSNLTDFKIVYKYLYGNLEY